MRRDDKIKLNKRGSILFDYTVITATAKEDNKLIVKTVEERSSLFNVHSLYLTLD